MLTPSLPFTFPRRSGPTPNNSEGLGFRVCVGAFLTQTYTFTDTHTHTHTYIHTYMCVCVPVCVCVSGWVGVCIYIYTR